MNDTERVEDILKDDISMLKKMKVPRIQTFEWELEIFPIMKPYSQVRQKVIDIQKKYMDTFGEPDYASRREDPLSINVKLWYLLSACIRTIPLPPTLESRMFFVDEIPSESIKYATESLNTLIPLHNRIELLGESEIQVAVEELTEGLQSLLNLCMPLFKKMIIISASNYEMLSKCVKLNENLNRLVIELKVEGNEYLEEEGEPGAVLKHSIAQLRYFHTKLWKMIRMVHLEIRTNPEDQSAGWAGVMQRDFVMIEEVDTLVSQLVEIGTDRILEECISTTQEDSSNIRKMFREFSSLNREIRLKPDLPPRDWCP